MSRRRSSDTQRTTERKIKGQQERENSKRSNAVKKDTNRRGNRKERRETRLFSSPRTREMRLICGHPSANFIPGGRWGITTIGYQPAPTVLRLISFFFPRFTSLLLSKASRNGTISGGTGSVEENRPRLISRHIFVRTDVRV